MRERPAGDVDYEAGGAGYARIRQPDPTIEAAIWAALGSARTVVNGRTQAGVDAALAKLRAAVPGGDFVGAAIDLGTAAGCDALVRAVPDCDILINNMLIDFEVPVAKIHTVTGTVEERVAQLKSIILNHKGR